MTELVLFHYKFISMCHVHAFWKFFQVRTGRIAEDENTGNSIYVYGISLCPYGIDAG